MRAATLRLGVRLAVATAQPANPPALRLESLAFDASRSVLVAPVLAGPDAGAREWDGARWAPLDVAGPVRQLPRYVAYPKGLSSSGTW